MENDCVVLGFTAMFVNIIVFWNVTLCVLVSKCRLKFFLELDSYSFL